MPRMHPAVRGAWRAYCRFAIQSWYGNPGVLMAAYVVLTAAATVVALSAHLVMRPPGYDGVLLAAVAGWRVSRGGWLSRGVLIYFAAGNLSWAASQFAQAWDIQVVILMAFGMAGLALLLSPAAYARTHPGTDAASSAIRLLPPPWMYWLAPLAGTAVAGLTVAVTRRWYLPGSGCRIDAVQVLPRLCTGSGRGFPLPVIADVHGHHTVSLLDFARDCAQWTAVLFVAGCLLWLALHRRHHPPQAVGQPVASPLPSR